MQTVWKFPLPFQNEIAAPLPMGAKLLHIGMQNGAVTLWALVDPMRPMNTRQLILRGTGHPIESIDGIDIAHIGSTIDRQSGLVWHVFERVS